MVVLIFWGYRYDPVNRYSRVTFQGQRERHVRSESTREVKLRSPCKQRSVALLCSRISLDCVTITSVDKSERDNIVHRVRRTEKKPDIRQSHDMLNIELKCGISCFKVRLVTLISNYSSVIVKTPGFRGGGRRSFESSGTAGGYLECISLTNNDRT